MPSKELIAELGEVLFQEEYGKDAGKVCYHRNYYERLAQAAISTILSALQEPTPAMQLVVSANWGRRTWAEYQQVLAASALGEQSK